MEGLGVCRVMAVLLTGFEQPVDEASGETSEGRASGLALSDLALVVGSRLRGAGFG